MMIRICRTDGTYDMVKASHLERLMLLQQVHCFKRNEGWTVVGRDPIRNGHGKRYTGPERRKSGTNTRGTGPF